MSNSSIWAIGRPLSDAITPGQSRLGSDGNEGILGVPQSSSIFRASPSDGWLLYPGQSFGEGSYSFAEMQSVYSKAPAVSA